MKSLIDKSISIGTEVFTSIDTLRNSNASSFDLPIEDVSSKSIRGAYFTVASRLLALILTLGSQAFLGRWLSPNDYGLYALGLTTLNFLLILREFGLQAAGVQKKNLSHEEASFLFWANLALIIIVGLIGVALAPFVEAFYQEKGLTLVLEMMILAAILGGLSAQHTMLLRRKMSFSKIAMAEILALASGIGAALFVGYIYSDVRALLALYIVQQSVLSVITFLLSGWLPGRPSWVADASMMLRFGIGVAAANFLYFVTNNISTILIGYNLHGAILGQFNRAQQLYLIPSSIMASSIYLVVFGSLSRLNGSSDLYRSFYQATLTRVSCLFFAASGFLMISGDDVVSLILGPQWGLAGTLLRIMSFGLIGAGAAQMGGLLLQSQARIKEFQFWGIVDGAIRICSIFVGSYYGIVGIVVAFAIATTLLTAPASLWFVGRKGPINLKHFIQSLKPAMLILCFSITGAGVFKYVTSDYLLYTRLFICSLGSLLFIIVGAALFEITRVPVFAFLKLQQKPYRR